MPINIAYVSKPNMTLETISSFPAAYWKDSHTHNWRAENHLKLSVAGFLQNCIIVPDRRGWCQQVRPTLSSYIIDVINYLYILYVLLTLTVSIHIACPVVTHVHVCSLKVSSQSQLPKETDKAAKPNSTRGKDSEGVCKLSDQLKGVTKNSLLWEWGQDGPDRTSQTSVAQVWPYLKTQYAEEESQKPYNQCTVYSI